MFDALNLSQFPFRRELFREFHSASQLSELFVKFNDWKAKNPDARECAALKHFPGQRELTEMSKFIQEEAYPCALLLHECFQGATVRFSDTGDAVDAIVRLPSGEELTIQITTTLTEDDYFRTQILYRDGATPMRGPIRRGADGQPQAEFGSSCPDVQMEEAFNAILSSIHRKSGKNFTGCDVLLVLFEDNPMQEDDEEDRFIAHLKNAMQNFENEFQKIYICAARSWEGRRHCYLIHDSNNETGH